MKISHSSDAADGQQLDLFTLCSAMPFSFGLFVRHLCDQHETRSEDLADAVGISDRLLRAHLGGTAAPSAEQRSRYATFFGFDERTFDLECRLFTATGTAPVNLAIDAIKTADAKAIASNTPTVLWLEKLIREA